MALSPLPADFRETVTSPRREVLPSVSMASIATTVPDGTSVLVYQTVDPSVTPTEGGWLLTHRSVFDFMLSNYTSGTGSKGYVRFYTWAGIVTTWESYDIVPLALDAITVRIRYRIPGYAVRMYMTALDDDMNVDGFIRVRSEA